MKKNILLFLLLPVALLGQNYSIQNNTNSILLTPQGIQTQKNKGSFLLNDNVSLGHDALKNNKAYSGAGIGNTAIGFRALRDNAIDSLVDSYGFYNTAIGNNALLQNQTGYENTAIGKDALTFGTSAKRNVAVGASAGRDIEADYTIAIGVNAMSGRKYGNRNTIIGYEAGLFTGSSTTVDSANVLIGYKAGSGINLGSNKLYISNSETTNPLLWGDFNLKYLGISGKLGINIKTPANNLHIHETSAANSFASFTNSTSGSTFTDGLLIGINNSADAFILQRENKNLFLGTNNYTAMNIRPDGNVGIGSLSSDFKLQIQNGDLAIYNSFDAKNWLLSYNASIDYFGIFENNTSTPRFVITNGGNVGIGTTSPTSRLQVNNGTITLHNTTDNKRWSLGYESADDYFYIDELGIGRRFYIKNGGNVGIGIDHPSEMLHVWDNIQSWNYYAENNIGIRTTTPDFPLEINGASNRNYSYGYLNGTAHTGVASGFNDYSMKASHRILATEFNAYSDARHKKVLHLANNTNDLKLLTQLKIRHYQYIDTISKGNLPKYGFIAQEIEEVLPEAVTKIGTEYIPDMFCLAKKIMFDESKHELRITLPRAHNYNTGDVLKIITDKEHFKTVIQVIDNQTIVVDNWLEKTNKAFIFGKKVNDFRTVDYDRIFTLGISAIQELNKEIENMKTSYEQRLSALEAKMNNILNQTGK
ncbi:tail fiber domain-containing protein [Emticicia sp. BO119]|uniref:tail fiber domain-containing protein n=1 Tax=Emticicia sp. BO119 TaxID=2757768 RepID=UPI0015F0665D|nr:tail fiber domain-containing protein [Emticicia sp. BO119]MBA4853101.1 tail fiber domain-containing protein [Emticicia sp. BO119]